MKNAIFHRKALAEIRNFPCEVREKLGKAVRLLQEGHSLGMPSSRPMPHVGSGVSELRVRGKDGIYRVFYLVKSERGVVVFHAFVKKTQKTPPLELRLAAARLREMINEKG